MIFMTYSHHRVSNITVGWERCYFCFIVGWLASPQKKRNWHVHKCLIHITFFWWTSKKGNSIEKYLHLQSRPFVPWILEMHRFPHGNPKNPEKSKNHRPRIHTTPKRFQEELANSSPRVAKCHLQNPCFPPRKWTPPLCEGGVSWSNRCWAVWWNENMIFQLFLVFANHRVQTEWFKQIHDVFWNTINWLKWWFFLTWKPFRLPWNLKKHSPSIQWFCFCETILHPHPKNCVSRF